MFKKIILPYTASLGMQLLRSDPAGAERRRSGGGGVHWLERNGEQRSWPQSRTVSLLLITSNSREKRHSSAPESAVRLFSGSTNTPSTLTLCCTAETHPQPFVTSSFNDAPVEKINWNFHLHQLPALLMNISEACELCVVVQDWLHQHFILIIVQWWQSRAGGKPIPANIPESGLELSTISLMGEHWMHVVDGWSVIVSGVILQDIQNDSYM